jgi:hypothetical protein
MEVWKDIPGFEGKYQISSIGNAKSLAKEIHYKTGAIYIQKEDRVLKNILKGTGYWVITPSNGANRKQTHIHRLVAEVFIPNPHNHPHVNHINGIKTDNRVENLEWCTPGENSKHAYRTGLKLISEKQKAFIGNYSKEFLRRKVLQLDMGGNYISSFISMKEASEQTGAHKAAISACCRGKIKAANNFKFKYAS